MTERAGLLSMLLRVVWWSVLAGLTMQVLVLTLGTTLGAEVKLASALIGAMGKVSWATLVCSALAIGLSLPRASTASSALWGLLGAPVAFHTARAAQQALNASAGLVASSAPTVVVWTTAGLKGLQYAGLAATLLWLNRRPGVSAIVYAMVGLGFGLSFGLPITGLGAPNPPTLLAIVPTAANEVLFPAACAVVVYGTTRVGELLSRGER